MSSETRIFIVGNIKLPINASSEEAFSVAKKKLSALGVRTSDLTFTLHRKSVDARRKSDIRFVYSVAVRGKMQNIAEDVLKRSDITDFTEVSLPDFPTGSEVMKGRPLIVGAGPCGLFAALLLAERGYKPILIERGGSVSERKKAVERFNKFQILDSETNIQFGAGGAGTFSDGKLVTRINDPISSYVFGRLVEFGAPSEIMYLARPHIGTDILSDVVDRIIDEIIRLGGEVRFHTKYMGTRNISGTDSAITNNGEIEYGALILAIGNSARDTYTQLISAGYDIQPKNISVGMRIEHLAENIDRALYGDFAGHPNLGHAEYNLSHNTKERGVYTFCMCPGGEVVAAASEEGGVVVNGMSAHARSGKNSNSAVVCTIFKEDYGNTAKSAIDFQRKIERSAYLSGGSDYSAPIITVGDFLSGRVQSEPTEVIPTYMNSSHTKIASPSEYLPDFVCESIKNALYDFDRKIKGFASKSAILTGAETRTSAPVRIIRDSETRIAPGTRNVYPCGEGAGYAGGITSAAIDGIKTALAVMKKYAPTDLGG